MKTTERIEACWDISLNVTCPTCEEWFDIIASEDDFWGYIEPIENGTNKTTDYDVTCPTCDEEFKCDFVW